MNANVKYLQENGPSPLDDLPYSPKRQYGIRKFALASTRMGSVERGGGHQTPVFYLDEHPPKLVLRCWVAENRSIVNERPAWSLHQKVCDVSSEWTDASYDILGPFHHTGNGGARETGGTCPMCGGEYENQLPDHLPECDA